MNKSIMSKIATVLVCTVGICLANAQVTPPPPPPPPPSPSVKISSSGEEIEIVINESEELSKEEATLLRKEAQALVKLRAKEMKAEIDEVRERYKSGEITLDEMTVEIEEIANKRAREIEIEAKALEEAVRKEVEAKTRTAVTKSGSVTIVEKDTQDASIRVKIKGKPKPLKRTYLGFTASWGWHTMILNNPKVEGNIYPEMDFWRGGFSEYAIMGNTRLGASRSPIWLNYGASLVYNRANIGGNNYLVFQDGMPSFEDRGVESRKANLRTAYVNGTIGFKIAPKGIKKFFVETNAFGGVLFRTKQDIEYRVPGSTEEVKETRRGNYGVNRFNYGLSAAVGYDFFSLYARYDMAGFFNNNSVYDYTPITVGLKFNFF
jgi:hypothetical protein